MNTLYFIVLYLSVETVYTKTVYKKKSCSYSPYCPMYDKGKRRAFNLDWANNRYKIYGKTEKDGLCIDNCVDGTCITGWDYNTRKPCTVDGNMTTLVYFTARYYRREKAICRSRCGKFGYDYEWCLVDKDYHWDYCSSEIYEGKTKIHLTIDKSRCITPCRVTPMISDLPLCKDAWDTYKECNPNMTVDYMPHRTIYGVICVSPCIRADPNSNIRDYWSYMCSDIHDKKELCAPPAQKFGDHTLQMYDRLTEVDPYRVEDVTYQIPYP